MAYVPPHLRNNNTISAVGHTFNNTGAGHMPPTNGYRPQPSSYRPPIGNSKPILGSGKGYRPPHLRSPELDKPDMSKEPALAVPVDIKLAGCWLSKPLLSQTTKKSAKITVVTPEYKNVFEVKPEPEPTCWTETELEMWSKIDNIEHEMEKQQDREWADEMFQKNDYIQYFNSIENDVYYFYESQMLLYERFRRDYFANALGKMCAEYIFSENDVLKIDVGEFFECAMEYLDQKEADNHEFSKATKALYL